MTDAAGLWFRRGVIADLPEVQRLNHDLFLFEDSLGFYHHSYNLEWPYSSSGEAYFRNRLDASSPNGAVFIALDVTSIVGYLAASFASYPYRSSNPIAEIENMFVVPERRRSGTGSGLVDLFKAWAGTAGAQRARVGAFTGNEDARRFYEHCGFVDSETVFETRL